MICLVALALALIALAEGKPQMQRFIDPLWLIVALLLIACAVVYLFGPFQVGR